MRSGYDCGVVCMFWLGRGFGVCTGYICVLGIGYWFESVALVVGGVIRLLGSGGRWWAVRWVAWWWLWMAEREMSKD